MLGFLRPDFKHRFSNRLSSATFAWDVYGFDGKSGLRIFACAALRTGSIHIKRFQHAPGAEDSIGGKRVSVEEGRALDNWGFHLAGLLTSLDSVQALDVDPIIVTHEVCWDLCPAGTLRCGLAQGRRFESVESFSHQRRRFGARCQNGVATLGCY